MIVPRVPHSPRALRKRSETAVRGPQPVTGRMRAPCLRMPGRAMIQRPSVRLAAIEGVDPETFQMMTYGVFGLTAASFVSLFFVLPRMKMFQDATTEVPWNKMYEVLSEKQNIVRPLSPADAQSKAKRGAVLVDVRLPQKYESARAENSVNVPLFVPIQKWDFPSILRRLGFAFFGIYGTEINPTFSEQLSENVKKGKEIILMCDTGGNLQNKQGTKTGFQSRSLKAAYYCLEAGYNKVFYVSGGFGAWTREGLEVIEAD